MTKPFALPELLSRVRNLLDRDRRLRDMTVVASSGPQRVTIGDAEVDFRTYQLTRGGESVQLTTMEAQLLRYFVQHAGAVLSRQQILKDVWEQDADITTRSIDNFVLRLRKYIEQDPATPVHLVSVRGTGYRFVASPQAAGSPSELRRSLDSRKRKRRFSASPCAKDTYTFYRTLTVSRRSRDRRNRTLC
ncbi:MAG: response regulator transcription factor [Planctomycetaceae bacterium]